jgi:hypothetical protein
MDKWEYMNTHTHTNTGNPLFKGWGEKEKAGGVLTVNEHYYYYHHHHWENKLHCSDVSSFWYRQA